MSLVALTGVSQLGDLVRSLHGLVVPGLMLPGLVGAGLAAAAVLVLLGGHPDTDRQDRQRSHVGPEGADPSAGPGGGADPSGAGARHSLTASAVSPEADFGGRAPGRHRLLRRGRRRVAELDDASDAQVSSALALLALAYRSGLPTWDVLEAVAAGLTGRASADLRQVATALRWGAGEPEAWASVGRVWAPAARAIAIAQQAGVPPGAMLLAASDDLRAAELERLEVSAAKVGVRLVAPLGLVLLPAFCLTTVAPLVIALAGGLLTG